MKNMIYEFAVVSTRSILCMSNARMAFIESMGRYNYVLLACLIVYNYLFYLSVAFLLMRCLRLVNVLILEIRK